MTLSVQTTDDPNALAAALVGSGLLGSGLSIVPGSASYTGAGAAVGTFTNGGTLGLSSGVILSTGNVSDAPLPSSDEASTSEGTAGNPALTSIAGAQTFDAATLTFQFTTSTGAISFSYVFGTEEYPYYVGQFDDAFGFFVDGKDIALIPGTQTPVSVNTVNSTTNSAYFRDNTPANSPYNVVYNGLTTVLGASVTGLSPGVHTIQLSVADASDSVLDSAVFLGAGTFSSNPTPPTTTPTPVTASAFDTAVESAPGLLAYYPFTSASQANSVVNGYTGVLQNGATIGGPGSGPPVNNASSSSLVLANGTSGTEYATAGGTNPLTGSIGTSGSILGWINLAALPSTLGRIFSIAGESQLANDFDLQINANNQLAFYTDSGSATVDPTPFTSANLGQYIFIAATFTSGTDRELYVNGSLVATSTPGVHTANSAPFYEGQSSVFGGRYFDGSLSDIAVYNTDLTASQITGIYNASSQTSVPTPAPTPVPTPAVFSSAPGDANKPDGLAGTTPYVFGLTRGGDVSSATTLSYVVAGIGSSPADPALFANPSGTVNFAAGVQTTDFNVLVNGAAITAPETFEVVLYDTAGQIVSIQTGEIEQNYTPAALPPGFAIPGAGPADPSVGAGPITVVAPPVNAVLSSPSESDVIPVSGATVGVDRFFNTQTGAHFYTGSAAEANQVEASLPSLKLEGLAFGAVDPAASVSDPAAISVYRFFDYRNGTQFLTDSSSERDQIVTTSNSLTYEGVAFYEDATQQANDVPVYRYFDTQNGTHFFTTSATEVASLASMQSEGIAFYAPKV